MYPLMKGVEFLSFQRAVGEKGPSSSFSTLSHLGGPSPSSWEIYAWQPLGPLRKVKLLVGYM